MKRYLIFGLLAGILTTGVCFNQITNVHADSMSENLVYNGDFGKEINNWSLNTILGGKGTASIEKNKLKVSIENLGIDTYSLMIGYSGRDKIYKKGRYRLQFDISSTSDRFILYSINDNNKVINNNECAGFDIIGNDVKTECIDFTMADDTTDTWQIIFQLGAMKKFVAENINMEINDPADAHDVFIDNVKLILVDGSEIGSEDEKKEEVKEQSIVCNQVGYRCNDIKKAVFKGQTIDRKFEIIDVESNKSVYEGFLYGTKLNESSAEVVSYGDFSGFNIPGRYKIKTENTGESYEFTIGDDVYSNLFKDALKFFYFQRCGQNLDKEHADKFEHSECHNTVASVYGTDKKIDVSGGWHDAADYGRYTVSAAKSVADLLSAYNSKPEAFKDNNDIPESNNNTPDILDEAKVELNWLLKMQDDVSGGVYHKVTTKNFASFKMPEDDFEELVVCPITTAATGDFAAVMAMAYDTYKDIDNSFAEKCLSASEKAWTYLEDTYNSGAFKNPDEIVTGEYSDAEDMDERYWAAAQLFKATKNEKYNNAFKALINAEGIKSGYGWESVGGYGNEAYLKAENADYNICRNIENSIISQADKITSQSKNDGYGFSNGDNYYWGSNLLMSNNAVLLAKAYEIKNNPEYLEYAREHINYCLGKNALGKSFVTGHGTNSVKRPHHIISKLKDSPIPGMIVGGPNDNREDDITKRLGDDVPNAKFYVDEVNAYSVNEVDICWNSAFVRALAETDRY